MTSILFTFTLPFNPERGGTERVADLLAKSLIKRGYRVLYLCAEYPDSYRGYNYPTEMNTLPNSDIYSQENFTFYENFLSDNSVDIIINHAHIKDYRLFLHGADNIKRVTIIHSRPSIYYHTLYKRKSDTLKGLFKHALKVGIASLKLTKLRYRVRRAQSLRYIANHSDHVCLLSNKFRAEFLQFAPSTPPSKLISIPNPNTYPTQQSLPQKSKTVLYVGRLTLDDKRFDRCVTVWRKIYQKFPDWQMIFVGDGDDRAHFEEVTKGINNIQCVGFQDPKPFYEQAAILCLTSNFEGFPMVLSEAMVHGVVPIAFNSFASATDIIEDGVDGVLVTPYSTKEYTHKLSTLMSNSKRREELSHNARQSIKRFDIERITDRWEEIINR